MKKFFLVFIGIVCVAKINQAQNCAEQSTFQKIIGHQSLDIFRSPRIVQYDDTSYVIEASINDESKPSDNGDVFVARVNENGEIIWARTFSQSLEYGYQIIVDNNKDIVVTGYTVNPIVSNVALFVTKYDGDGNLIFQQDYNSPNFESFSGLIETYDGGYLLGGYADGVSGGGGNFDLSLLKMSNTGVIDWSTTVGEFDENRGCRVAQLADSSIIFVGSQANPGSSIGRDVNIGSLNHDGSFNWNLRFDLAGLENVGLLAVDDDYAYVCMRTDFFSGDGTMDVVVTKRKGSDGTEVWTKVLSTDGEEEPACIMVDNSGVVVVGFTTGFNDNGETDKDIFAVRLATNGDILNTSVLDDSLDSRPYSIVGSSEAGYFVTGWSVNSPFNGDDLVLIKFNDCLESCRTENVVFKDSSFVLNTVDSLSTVSSKTYTPVQNQFALVDSLVLDTIFCEFVYEDTIIDTIIDDSSGNDSTDFILESMYDVLQVYPNPTKGSMLYVSANYLITQTRIVDMRGRTLYLNSEKLGVNQTAEIDLTNFAKGMYVVMIQTDKGRKSKKIMIN